MNKQKIIDYIEELERKAQDGERYFKYWHKEYHKNKQAIEYIKDNIIDFDFVNSEYPNRKNAIDIETNEKIIKDLLEILKGVDKE